MPLTATSGSTRGAPTSSVRSIPARATTEYPLLPFASNPGIDQIIAGPDGNIYFTEPNLNEIGMLDVKTDLISQFLMPLADTQPHGITVGTDGNLYFTEGGQNKMGSLNPYTHVIINYPFEPAGDSTNDLGEGITAAPNGTIWFVTQQNDDVNEFTIATGGFTKHSTPDAPFWPPSPPNSPPPTPSYADLWSIALGSDDNVYYTEPAYGWIGYIGDSGGGSSRIYYPMTLNGTSSMGSLGGALIANGAREGPSSSWCRRRLTPSICPSSMSRINTLRTAPGGRS